MQNPSKLSSQGNRSATSLLLDGAYLLVEKGSLQATQFFLLGEDQLLIFSNYF